MTHASLIHRTVPGPPRGVGQTELSNVEGDRWPVAGLSTGGVRLGSTDRFPSHRFKKIRKRRTI